LLFLVVENCLTCFDELKQCKNICCLNLLIIYIFCYSANFASRNDNTRTAKFTIENNDMLL